MSHSATSKALQLPEILEAIARFIPLFDEPGPLVEYYSFAPHKLLPCILVSRLWHRCFLPFLYHCYVDNHYTPPTSTSSSTLTSPVDSTVDTIVPAHIAAFRKHAQLFRRFIAYGARRPGALPFNVDSPPNNLIVLHLYGSTEMLANLLVANQGNQGQLKDFRWTGQWRVTTIDTPYREALMNLPRLETLFLEKWKCDNELLFGVLSKCQGTLRNLMLESIAGFDERLFLGTYKGNMVGNVASSECDHKGLDKKEGSPILQLTNLKHLRMLLDWTQSPAAVYIPCMCPALESLDLTVDEGKFDLTQLTTILRTHCPNLNTISYEEGYSMMYEHGYFPQPSIYASLYKDCAMSRSAQLRNITVALPLGLDCHMLEALLTHSTTLEVLDLRCCYDGRALAQASLDMSQMVLIFNRSPNLREVMLSDVNCAINSFDDLLSQPWVCRNLSSLVIDGYTPSYGADDDNPERLRHEKHRRRIREQASPRKSRLHEYRDDGQGWYLSPGLSEYGFSEALADGLMKRRLFEHMSDISGIRKMTYLRLNETSFFGEEQEVQEPE
ncbi:hypothetical protein BGZ58_003677 [Dissophora ornata]|nr:hypothetical protein BGZ58_003677 [Dissophora ornata]